jgi:hypothetical protein
MLVSPGKVFSQIAQENSMSTLLASPRTLQPDEPKISVFPYRF